MNIHESKNRLISFSTMETLDEVEPYFDSLVGGLNKMTHNFLVSFGITMV